MDNVQAETARKVPLFVRTPFIEMEGLFIDEDILNQEGEHSLHHNQIEIDPEMTKAMFHTVDHAENLPHLPESLNHICLLKCCLQIFWTRVK